MPAPLLDAIRRFRRRLLLAALVRGVSAAGFGALLLVALALLADSMAGFGLMATLPVWAVWGAVGVAGLVGGVVSRSRAVVNDEVVVQHLEQRLGTRGLLLAASDGVVLDASFGQRLEAQLAGASRVLPKIQWRNLLVRPLAAALLVVVAQYWLPEALQSRSSEALDVAVERLAKEVDEIAAMEAVPEERLEELRDAVEDLRERVKSADRGLWREVDALQERVDREEMLAAGQADRAEGFGAAGGGDDSVANEQAPLQAALRSLEQLDEETLGRLLARLPEDLREQAAERLADMASPGDRPDADTSSTEPALDAALAEAIAAAVDELGDELGEGLREQLADLALEMARSGAMDQLPDGLRETMAKAGLSALENLDLEQLRALLPDDLSQLAEMAEQFAELAKNMSLEAGQEGEAMLQQKLAALAEGLVGQGGSQLGPLGELARQLGGGQPMAGRDGGHDALRLTERGRAGVAAVDLELPGRKPEDLSSEWVPVTIQKAAPELGERVTPGAGREGAKGVGGAAWQLRLRPRHRGVVRRFFRDENK